MNISNIFIHIFVRAEITDLISIFSNMTKCKRDVCHFIEYNVVLFCYSPMTWVVTWEIKTLNEWHEWLCRPWLIFTTWLGHWLCWFVHFVFVILLFLFILRLTVFRKFHERRLLHWPDSSQLGYRWRTGGSKSFSCPCNNVRNLYYSHTHCSDMLFSFTGDKNIWRQFESLACIWTCPYLLDILDQFQGYCVGKGCVYHVLKAKKFLNVSCLPPIFSLLIYFFICGTSFESCLIFYQHRYLN